MEFGTNIPNVDIDSTERTGDNGDGNVVTPSLPPLLKEFHKIDMDTGARLDVLVIDVNHEEVPEDCKEGWGDRGFFNPVYNFDLNDWVENKPEEEILAFYKDMKDRELNKACQDSILAGFTHTIDGVEYFFSYDMQAQTNFGDSRALLNDGIITQVPWTVKQGEEYARITITKEIMDALTLTILMHKTANISKYRDVLLPLVNKATSLEEIQAVDWDD